MVFRSPHLEYIFAQSEEPAADVESAPTTPGDEIPAEPAPVVEPPIDTTTDTPPAAADETTPPPEFSGASEPTSGDITAGAELSGVNDTPQADIGAVVDTTGQDMIIENSQIQIEETSVDVLLKKDLDAQLKEIVTQENITITGAIGVTIVIQDNTIFFAPSTLSGGVDTGAIDTGSIATDLPAIEPFTFTLSTGEELPTGEITQVIENFDTIIEPIATLPDSPLLPITSGVQESPTPEEIILPEIFPPEDMPDDPFSGKETLKSENLELTDVEIPGNAFTDTHTNVDKSFSFGISDQHLVFSKPVEIQVFLPEVGDDSEVEMQVKHAGEAEFGKKGLSTDPDATCDEQGNISLPGNRARVSEGKATFYTCGASEFAVSVVNAVFNPNVSSTVNTLLIDADGDVLLGGAFTGIGGIMRNRIARVTATGGLDAGFTGNMNNTVNALALQSDGKIIVGGAITAVGAVTRNRIARVTTTGTLDTTFDPNANNTVNALAIQSDGRIILGGAFTSVSAVTRNRIARVSTTGTLDTTFNPNANSTINSLAIQSDGMILLGGAFSTLGGTSRSRLGRVNSTTGGLDNTFNPNVNSTVTALAIQPDGNIILGGAFTTVGGVTRNRIARITTTGALDTTFNPNLNNTVNSIILQSDGSILIAGAFTTVGGVTRNRIARLLPDGSLDTTFNPNANNTINALALDGDQSIYAGGNFTTMGGLTRNRFARIGLVTSVCAGTSGCILRLKGDTGVTLSGGGVSARESQGAQEITGIQTTGTWQPLYVTGVLNYNSVLHFDGVDDGLLVVNSFFDEDASQYAVFRSTDTSGTITTTANPAGFSATTCGRAFNLTGGKFTTVLSGNRITTTTSVNTNKAQLVSRSYGTGNPQVISVNGKVEATGTAWKPGVVTDLGMLIGKAVVGCLSGNALSGDIAEILSFHRRLSSSEELNVESYLAIKYGVTLDQTTPTDYTFPGGITAWSSNAAGSYNNDIAGIGRDDTSSLDQPQSQSVNSTGDIIVEFTGGALTDEEFLVRGNDNENITGWSLVDSPTNYQRLIRERKFEENNGDIGTTIVRLPSGTLPSGWTGNLFLFVDNDGVMAAGASIFTGTLVGSNREFVVNITDGQYITFGYNSPAGTLGITAPSALINSGVTPSFGTQTVEQYFNTNSSFYFSVVDELGSDIGYSTTLQMSGGLATGGFIIGSGNLAFKVSSLTPVLINGSANPDVLIDSNALNYQSLANAISFIYRNNGQNNGLTGTYGAYIWYQVIIPANQPPGAYQGTLVYTIIPN